MKKDYLKTKVKGNLTAIAWKDKQNVKRTDKHAFFTIGV